MAMTGIRRIPLEAETPNLHSLVHGELSSSKYAESLQSELLSLMHYCGGNAEHMECTLDWAMQIRETLGIDWANAIRAASILYLG